MSPLKNEFLEWLREMDLGYCLYRLKRSRAGTRSKKTMMFLFKKVLIRGPKVTLADMGYGSISISYRCWFIAIMPQRGLR